MPRRRRIRLPRAWHLQTGLLLCLCAIVIVGCSRKTDRPRAIVSGQVSYDGKPVEIGRIRFSPLPGTGGNLSTGIVKGGQYLIEDFGGVPVGKHRVEILSLDPNDPGGGGPGGPPAKQFLPAKYNDQSTLEVLIEGQKGKLVHDFLLEK